MHRAPQGCLRQDRPRTSRSACTHSHSVSARTTGLRTPAIIQYLSERASHNRASATRKTINPRTSRTIHVPVYNEIGANRGLVALRWYAKRPNDWEKTPLGGVFSLDWQLTLSPMT